MIITKSQQTKFKDQLSGLSNVTLLRTNKNGYTIMFRKGRQPNQIVETAKVTNFKQARILWSKFISENINTMEPILYSNITLSEYITNYWDNVQMPKSKREKWDNNTINAKKLVLKLFSEKFGHIKMTRIKKEITKDKFINYMYETYKDFAISGIARNTYIITRLFKDIVNDENQHIDKHIITSLSEYDMKGFGIPAKDRQYILRDDAMKIYLDFQEKLFEYIKNPITVIEQTRKNKFGTKYSKPSNINNFFYYGFMATTYIAIHTGMRISEISGLRWDDLHKVIYKDTEEISYRITIEQQIQTPKKILNKLKKKAEGKTRTIIINKTAWETIQGFRHIQSQMAHIRGIKDDYELVTSYPGKISGNGKDRTKLTTGILPFTRYVYSKYLPKPETVEYKAMMKSEYRKSKYEYFSNLGMQKNGFGIWNQPGRENKPYENVGIKWHMFRHGYAMQFIIDNNGSMKHILKEFMGHEKDDEVDLYSKLARDNGLLPEDAYRHYEKNLYNKNI